MTVTKAGFSPVQVQLLGWQGRQLLDLNGTCRLYYPGTIPATGNLGPSS